MNVITIAGNVLSEYKIICGESGPEQYAASELKKYFEKITGEEFAGGGNKTISLKIDTSCGLVNDGFIIRNTENELSVVGGGGRGVIYGAYEVLEKYLGVRFFLPGLEKLGEGGDIPLIDEYRFEPIFTDFRQSDWMCVNDYDWCVKNRISRRLRENENCIPEEMGGTLKRGNRSCHTVGEIYGISQKEQPCLTEPENLEKAKAYVRRILENNPDSKVINVSQNDCSNYCTCEKCAAIDAEEGSHMGTMIRFINAIADDIKDDYPDVAIETLAYVYTRKPAKTPPRDNVIISLCSVECCASHPLDDPTCEQNVAFKRDIIGWSKICSRIAIWDYVVNFAHYLLTYPNLNVLRHNMRFFAEHGVSAMYPEGNFNGKSGEFGELRAYLLAKLMWNPLMSEVEYQRHIDEFLEAYYGEGWRYIRAYIDFTSSEANRVHSNCYIRPYDLYDFATINAMVPTIEAWWNAAEAMADDKIEHVKRSRLQWRYLHLWSDYDYERAKRFYDDAFAMGTRWSERRMKPGKPEFDKYILDWYMTDE